RAEAPGVCQAKDADRARGEEKEHRRGRPSRGVGAEPDDDGREGGGCEASDLRPARERGVRAGAEHGVLCLRDAVRDVVRGHGKPPPLLRAGGGTAATHGQLTATALRDRRGQRKYRYRLGARWTSVARAEKVGAKMRSLAVAVCALTGGFAGAF